MANFMKGELNPADELRKTVSQNGEEGHVPYPKHASDNAGPVSVALNLSLVELAGFP